MILPISGAYFGKFGPLKWLLGAYFITQDPQKGTNGDPTQGLTLYGANLGWGQVYELRRSIITSLIYQKSQNLTTNEIWSKIGISKAFLDL